MRAGGPLQGTQTAWRFPTVFFSKAGATFCGDQPFSLFLGIGISRSTKSADSVRRLRGRSTKCWHQFEISRTLCKCCRLKVHQQLRANLCHGTTKNREPNHIGAACLHMRAAPSSTHAGVQTLLVFFETFTSNVGIAMP